MAKVGRKPKPYVTSWGEVVPGLARQSNDGRWRVVATGHRFTEPDERLAVHLFRQRYSSEVELVQVPVLGSGQARTNEEVNQILGPRAQTVYQEDGDSIIIRLAHPNAVWGWLRQLLIEKPEHVAKMTGIPQVANLRHMALPRPRLALSTLIQAYREKNPSTEKAKREAIAPLERLIEHAHAKTLDDLTTDALIAFRQTIEACDSLKSSGTRRGYFGRIKAVIGFGRKVGLDPNQITACLDRCRVLWTAEPLPAPKPAPISRTHFHALLVKGGDAWRPWLLLGLNLCLHLDEVCDLRWADFNLEQGTYAAIRNKTRRQRIPRAAVLWPETIEALKRIKRVSPYVLISSHGTRFNRNTRGRAFGALRKAAGIPETVTYDCLRDASYTAAAQAPGVDEKFARLLAGQRSPGLQDNYVLRNPDCVRPACDAVYRAFGPFPDPSVG